VEGLSRSINALGFSSAFTTLCLRGDRDEGELSKLALALKPDERFVGLDVYDLGDFHFLGDRGVTRDVNAGEVASVDIII
jgi:hypothetical protein